MLEVISALHASSFCYNDLKIGQLLALPAAPLARHDDPASCDAASCDVYLVDFGGGARTTLSASLSSLLPLCFVANSPLQAHTARVRHTPPTRALAHIPPNLRIPNPPPLAMMTTMAMAMAMTTNSLEHRRPRGGHVHALLRLP